MELRSRDLTNYDGEDGSTKNVKATPLTGSDSGTSSGSRNRKTGSSSSDHKTSSSSRRESATKSASACSNNEHCSTNKPLSQRASATMHDSTNGQVMGSPGNHPPAGSASSANSQQRDALLYDFLSQLHITQSVYSVNIILFFANLTG